MIMLHYLLFFPFSSPIFWCVIKHNPKHDLVSIGKKNCRNLLKLQKIGEKLPQKQKVSWNVVTPPLPNPKIGIIILK
jgi:hypothetical protein